MYLLKSWNITKTEFLLKKRSREKRKEIGKKRNARISMNPTL